MTEIVPSAVLKRVVLALERLRLRYFVTGSVASMYYGEPRLTMDIDIVVELPLERVGDFCQAFPVDEFYVSEDAARDAVRRCGQFNIIHPESGFKIDIMIPTNGELDRSRLQRARRVTPLFADYEALFSSPEDVILKKLDFYREGQSEKHLRDIASMLKVLGDRIELRYIEQWVGRLSLSDEWQLVRKRADGPPNV